MSESTRMHLSWVFVGLVVLSGALLFGGSRPAGASDDHDIARELRAGGEVIPLAQLLGREELRDMRVLEAELDRKRGRMVYELELLDASGRVSERYFDATTGEPLGERER